MRKTSRSRFRTDKLTDSNEIAIFLMELVKRPVQIIFGVPSLGIALRELDGKGPREAPEPMKKDPIYEDAQGESNEIRRNDSDVSDQSL